jgi:death on curing protein
MITLEEILKLHDLSISFFGGSSGIRSKDLLESAISRPFQTFDGAELYPSHIEKAAALMESLIKKSSLCRW